MKKSAFFSFFKVFLFFSGFFREDGSRITVTGGIGKTDAFFGNNYCADVLPEHFFGPLR